MSNEEHLGGCIINEGHGDTGTYAPQVWDFLIDRLNIKSIIDVGCGAGYSLQYFLNKGLIGIGVEGFEYAISRSPVKKHLVLHDYTKDQYVSAGEYDLAWSCEFVEHVEEQYVPNFMATFMKAKYVAMTHAVPGQPGHHHVNCQTADYWIDIFKKHCFELCQDLSLEARNKLNNCENGGHVKNTLMIFKRTW
jgi:cyclopropane fatty-acyl-phospholipid synthase-like methyltransferase